MSPFLVNLFGVVIVVLIVAGVDMLLGAKGFFALNRIFNRKVDVDSAILKGLAELRGKGDKEVIRLDEAALRGRLRIFLGLLLLVPAVLLLYAIFLRK